MEKMMRRPAVLMILDGFGVCEEEKGNAVKLARTPNIDRLIAEYPHTLASASGLDVGLPDGQMGNSEVGHLNMGAGRIVYQDLTKITKSIQDGDFYENPELIKACEAARGHSLHLWGLMSDGGVHSHNTHVYGLLELARRQGVKNVYIHCFMDGRDTDPQSGCGYVKALQQVCDEKETGVIATVVGRYYAMDRDKRWDRVKRAYDALTLGEGTGAADMTDAIEGSYAAGVTDEFIEPIVKVDAEGRPVGRVEDGDAVIMFNFRPDRAREITRSFTDPDFAEFEHKQIRGLTYVGFTEYDKTIPNMTVAFPKQEPKNTLGEYVSSLGLTQLRLAETEKYAHVTFFFNGGVEEPFAGEDRILVPSPKVATYDLQPEMSAPEVGDDLAASIRSGKYDMIIINFANPDMVGHTGVLEAAVKAVETVDTQVGKAVDALKEMGGQMILCADHGNSDVMMNPDGSPMTAHTTNPVPVILINAGERYALRSGGRLCDLAPTMLQLMGIAQPEEMTGRSLLTEKDTIF